MGLGSEFGDVLDSLRKEIADSLGELEAIGRGGGDVAAARAGEEAAEDIAPEERAARQLTLEDFLRRIRGKRALAEELAAYRGTTIEDELRALREAELADEERLLRERVGRYSGLKKALLAGLGIGGAGLAGLALYSYLNNRNQSSPYNPSSPYNLPYNLPPTNLPSSPYNLPPSPGIPSSPSAPGGIVPSSPSSPAGVVPSSPSSPSSPSGSLEADLNKKVFGVPVWVWIVIALVIIALVLYYYYHKKHKHG
ncbi:hypothetical protein [Sulfolobus acidocaldarius]|uniref:hypothetical protein n=1 Tax=Sulfolobus acidocaldarius TaxID=2285 RepID=UPI000AEA709D|nr:hypothetical protein [Sulfolobus acidocaldarius]